MKRSSDARARNRRFLVLGLVAGSLACAALAATPQTPPPSYAAPPKLIYSVKGPELFRTYCATCHGLDAKGDGPMAPALKTSVPDLTMLTRNNKGQFPTILVRKVIAGDQLPVAHGSREMPVWGPIFHQVEDDQDFGAVRLENLVKYLQSIQGK